MRSSNRRPPHFHRPPPCLRSRPAAGDARLSPFHERAAIPAARSCFQNGIFATAPFFSIRRASRSQPLPICSSATRTMSDLPVTCRPFHCLESPATQLGHVVRISCSPPADTSFTDSAFLRRRTQDMSGRERLSVPASPQHSGTRTGVAPRSALTVASKPGDFRGV